MAPLAALKAAGQTGAASKPKPNVVLIISDQFRWDCIGAMGLNPMGLTPNLDGMARRGAGFRSAMGNQPVCAPARASIFTGEHPSTHEAWRKGGPLCTTAATIRQAPRTGGETPQT